jgi:hypothetical protein
MPPLPPGWYPDPSGAPGKRYFDGRDWTVYLADPTGAARAPIAQWPSRRRIPSWWWIALVAVLAVIIAITGIRLAGSGNQQSAPPPPTSSTLAASPSTEPPSTTPPRSKLVRVTLPRGSTPTAGPTVPGVETWHVRLPVPETVAKLRAQLPIAAAYDRLPWCAESIELRTNTTRWSWGTADDLLRIVVGPFYPTIGVRGPDSQVTITRQPDLQGVGCR